MFLKQYLIIVGVLLGLIVLLKPVQAKAQTCNGTGCTNWTTYTCDNSGQGHFCVVENAGRNCGGCSWMGGTCGACVNGGELCVDDLGGQCDRYPYNEIGPCSQGDQFTTSGCTISGGPGPGPTPTPSGGGSGCSSSPYPACNGGCPANQSCKQDDTNHACKCVSSGPAPVHLFYWGYIESDEDGNGTYDGVVSQNVAPYACGTVQVPGGIELTVYDDQAPTNPRKEYVNNMCSWGSPAARVDFERFGGIVRIAMTDSRYEVVTGTGFTKVRCSLNNPNNCNGYSCVYDANTKEFTCNLRLLAMGVNQNETDSGPFIFYVKRKITYSPPSCTINATNTDDTTGSVTVSWSGTSNGTVAHVPQRRLGLHKIG